MKLSLINLKCFKPSIILKLNADLNYFNKVRPYRLHKRVKKLYFILVSIYIVDKQS